MVLLHLTWKNIGRNIFLSTNKNVIIFISFHGGIFSCEAIRTFPWRSYLLYGVSHKTKTSSLRRRFDMNIMDVR